MKILSKAIYVLSITCFIGIQFAIIIDDSDHISEPDPNCPICIAAHTSVFIDPDITISFTPDIIFCLNENSGLNLYSDYYYLILSIRAPPLS